MLKFTSIKLKRAIKRFKPKRKFLIIAGCLILTFATLIFFETRTNSHPLVSVWNFAYENIFSSPQEKTIELTNKWGFKIGSTGLLETVDGYQVKIETKGGLVEIEGLTNPGDIKAKIDNINQRGISTEVVSIRDGFSGYKKARVRLAKTGNSDITAIISCPDFNFEKFSCPSGWEPIKIAFAQTKDYIEFEVDHFSAYAGTSLTIFNIQSNLTQGDIWAVRFQTYGKDDLTIIPIKGTDYSEDLEFLGFYCGENRIDNVFDDEKVFIPSYQCEQESRIENKALTSGQHFLQFIFGETVAEAHNFACNSGTLDTTCYVTSSQSITDEETISGTGNLVIQSGGRLTCATGSNFYINMGGNITIEATTTVGIACSVWATSTDFTINTGASINVDSKGYRGGYRDGNAFMHGEGKGGLGPTYGGGEGYNGSSFLAAGGGAYGGNGANSATKAGGQAYGSSTQPTDLGAGGGGVGYSGTTWYGGNGGGVIKLNISGAFAINGQIKAGGQNGTGSSIYAPGGGAGGSIWITAGTISGSGTISANGGNGCYYDGYYWGGGGAGGRMAIYYTTSTFSGSYRAYSGSGYQFGGAGTIYKKQSSQTNFDLTIDNGTNVAQADTPLGTNDYTIDNLIIDYAKPTLTGSITVTQSINDIDYSTVTISNTLTLPSNLSLSNNSTLSITSLIVSYNITVASGSNITHAAKSTSGLQITAESLNIQSGSYVNVDSKGYRGGYRDGNASMHGEGKGGLGPTYGGGEGYNGSSFYAAGGGAYGGNGGNSATKAGGQAYGSSTQPTDLGAGGGGVGYSGTTWYGGNGGGAIKLNISGTLAIAGEIKTSGQNGTGDTIYAPGGGAGGSIWITAGTISGSGTISAKGGNGRYYDGYYWGGGGAGGRIAIYYKIDYFSGSKLVSGGTGYIAGSTGTIYLEQTERVATSTISGVIRLGADRHTFYDSTYYWAFYIDVSGAGKVVYEKSLDGINWLGSITEVGTSTAPYSSLGIWEDNTSIWVAYASSSLSYTRKITISDGTLGTQYSTTTSAIYHPQIIKDSNNYLWRKGETSTSSFYVQRSINPNDSSSWEPETNIGFDTSGYGHLMLLPMSSAKVMALYNDYDGAYNLKYKIYNAGWGSATIVVSDCKDNTVSSDWSLKHWFSAVADSSGYVHLIYVDSDDNDLNYTYFNGTSWSSPVEIYTGTVSYPSLSIDNSNNLYAFWIEDKNVKYKVSEGTSWGGSTATLKGNIVFPSYLGSAYSDNLSIGVIWREGNSYDVIFDKVTVGTFPSSIWLKGNIWLKGGIWLK